MKHVTENTDEILGVSPSSSPRRSMRNAMFLGLIFALILGPYVFYRVSSGPSRIRVVEVSEQSSPRDFDGTLKVVAWNIAHGRGVADSNWVGDAEQKAKRVMEIAQLIRQLEADVVVLNEVDFAATWSGHFNQAAGIAEAAGFPFFARQANLDFGFLFGRFQFGNVVLSRYPITQARALDLPPYREWEDWLVGRKRGVLCTVAIGKSRSVSIAGLHLEHRSEACRVESVRYLQEELAQLDGPLILLGDLNTTPRNSPQSRETADGYNAFDLLNASIGLQSAPLQILNADQLTFPAWAPVRAIDWILYRTKFFKLVEHEVVPTQLSDHRPVVATFRSIEPSRPDNN